MLAETKNSKKFSPERFEVFWQGEGKTGSFFLRPTLLFQTIRGENKGTVER